MRASEKVVLLQRVFQHLRRAAGELGLPRPLCAFALGLWEPWCSFNPVPFFCSFSDAIRFEGAVPLFMVPRDKRTTTCLGACGRVSFSETPVPMLGVLATIQPPAELEDPNPAREAGGIGPYPPKKLLVPKQAVLPGLGNVGNDQAKSQVRLFKPMPDFGFSCFPVWPFVILSCVPSLASLLK